MLDGGAWEDQPVSRTSLASARMAFGPETHKPTRGTREQRVRFGTFCNHFEMSFDDVRRIWQAADRFGFDAAVTMDNSVAGVPGHPDRPVCGRHGDVRHADRADVVTPTPT